MVFTMFVPIAYICKSICAACYPCSNLLCPQWSLYQQDYTWEWLSTRSYLRQQHLCLLVSYLTSFGLLSLTCYSLVNAAFHYRRMVSYISADLDGSIHDGGGIQKTVDSITKCDASAPLRLHRDLVSMCNRYNVSNASPLALSSLISFLKKGRTHLQDSHHLRSCQRGSKLPDARRGWDFSRLQYSSVDCCRSN